MKHLYHKVLVIMSGISNKQMVYDAVGDIEKWLYETTGKELLLEVDYVDYSNTKFETETIKGKSGVNYTDYEFVAVKNQPIVKIGHDEELKQNKEYDSVCLMYSPQIITGKLPTNPVHTGLLYEGFTPFQVIFWDENQQRMTLAETFAHELLHAWYYLAKIRGNWALKDDVHTHSGYQDPRPHANFSNIVNKLKPYWNVICSLPMLQHITLAKRKITAHPEMIKRLLAAHQDALMAGISVRVGLFKQKGLVIGGIYTSSWRTAKIQQELYDKGSTKTLVSNHMRGTAVDLYPNSQYIKDIESIMEKHELVNDINGDSVHFNLISNSEAAKYPIIRNSTSVPYANVDEALMKRFEGKDVWRVEHMGEVYSVEDGKITKIEHRGGRSSLFDHWSHKLVAHGDLIPINEHVWDKIKEAHYV